MNIVVADGCAVHLSYALHYAPCCYTRGDWILNVRIISTYNTYNKAVLAASICCRTLMMIYIYIYYIYIRQTNCTWSSSRNVVRLSQNAAQFGLFLRHCKISFGFPVELCAGFADCAFFIRIIYTWSGKWIAYQYTQMNCSGHYRCGALDWCFNTRKQCLSGLSEMFPSDFGLLTALLEIDLNRSPSTLLMFCQSPIMWCASLVYRVIRLLWRFCRYSNCVVWGARLHNLYGDPLCFICVIGMGLITVVDLDFYTVAGLVWGRWFAEGVS